MRRPSRILPGKHDFGRIRLKRAWRRAAQEREGCRMDNGLHNIDYTPFRREAKPLSGWRLARDWKSAGGGCGSYGVAPGAYWSFLRVLLRRRGCSASATTWGA